MQHFLESPAKVELLQVTAAMGRSCASQDVEYQYDPSTPLACLFPPMAALHGSLQQMHTWMAEISPLRSKDIRFGNPSFRKWHERLVERSASIVYCIIQTLEAYADKHLHEFDIETLKKASEAGYEAATKSIDVNDLPSETDRVHVEELSAYLQAAFGHPIRLDYGTGHESSFQVLLFALTKLGCLGSTKDEPPSPKCLKATTLSIYSAYLSVTRQVQTDYMLEPAGSHGVWGLDDYHCLPFYFGACQMQSIDDCDSEYRPSSIHDDNLLKREGDRYLYYGCIRHIKELKKSAPFFESSPMLNDISHLPTWSKVASGLLKMYEGEVLKKRVVVQHFVFGNLFAANWTPSQDSKKKAPTRTFRQPELPVSGAAMIAPWAHNPSGVRPQEAMPPTKAPWAGNEGHQKSPVPPTKAPWAK
jgi:serine/threonine-protein phosphatase 2A activator